MTPLAARVAPFGKQAFGLAAVMGGSIVATVLGVPIGTHLGQQVGWQGSFFIVGMAAVLVWVIIFFSLPVCTSNRAGSLKSLPSLFKRPALVQLYLLTMVVILGQFTVYSYITPILMNVGHLSESATVWFLFIFGIAGIIGTVISSRTVDKHRSGTLVIPMLIMTVCVGLLTVTSSHFGALVILGTFWGASMTAISMAFQTLLLDTAEMLPTWRHRCFPAFSISVLAAEPLSAAECLLSSVSPRFRMSPVHLSVFVCWPVRRFG